MSEEASIVHHHHRSHSTNDSSLPPPPPPQYGTFEGIPQSTPPEMDFGRVVHHHHHPGPPHHRDDDYNPFPPPLTPGGGARFPYAYQTVPGYAVAQGTPVVEYRRPCFGQGVGGCLFLIFFIAVVIWMLAQLL